MRTTETTRVRVLRPLAVGLALALVAAACGGDDAAAPTDPESPTNGAEPGDDVDPDGILRFGTELTVLGGNRALDPSVSRSVGDFLHLQLIYDTLLRARPDGTFDPGLAESFEIDGDDTVTLTLREGLTFHDGEPVTADAVKQSIERNIAEENTNHAPLITQIASVEAHDDRTVTITLAVPQIGAFFELLAGRETMPVSPAGVAAGTLNEEPIGAGPYQLTDFQPERLIELRKFEDHWEADAWQLAGIDFIQAPSGPPRVSVIQAGQADFVDLAADQVADLAGSPNITAQPTTSDADFIYLATCKDRPPFDDLAFREGISYALDRDVFNDVLLSGQGEPMWTMWPEGSPFFTEALAGQFAHDPDMALQRLADAGWNEGDTLEVAVPAGNVILERAAEIVQDQLADVGIVVSIEPTQDIVTDFYVNVQQTAAVSFWIRPGLQKITRAFGPASVANVCDFDDAELNDLSARIAALPPDDPEVGILWDEINTFVTDNVLWNLIAWQPLVHAWTDDVGGVDEIFPAIQGPNFRSLYMRQS